MGRRTKIVATLGPASEGADQIDALLAAGVDVFRLNLSHGELAEHLARLEVIRSRSAAAGRPVAVLADLPGPKVRAGAFPDGGAFLMEGAPLRLVPGSGPSSGERVTVEYPELIEDVRYGDRIVLGDGAIVLTVTGVDGDGVDTEVVTGGRAQGQPGVHLPDRARPLRLPDGSRSRAGGCSGRYGDRLSGGLVRPFARRSGAGAGGDRSGRSEARRQGRDAIGGRRVAGHPRAGRRRRWWPAAT